MISQSRVVEPRETHFTVEDVTTAEAFARIAPEWQALSERADTALLFNSYEWSNACWRHFHDAGAQRGRAKFWVLAVRDALGLRAIVPLRVEIRRFLGLSTRIVRFLGEGPSDYCDLLVAPSHCGAIEAVIAHLSARPRNWDLLELREFFGESPNLRELIEGMRTHGWRVHQLDDSSCPTIFSSRNGWETYYHARFNSESRRYHRRDWRRLEKTGALSVELLTDVTRATQLTAAFGEVEAAHPDAGDQRPGEFNDPWIRPFLDEMLATASVRGWLRLPILWRDGVLVAYFIAFLYKGRYYLYNTSYRADCQRYGVGKLLMLYMLERFFAEGGGVIDYLRGGELYKDAWTEQTQINARLQVARPGLRALIGRLVWFDLMPWLARRTPLVHRALVLASEEGIAGLATRARRRLIRGN